MALRMLSCLGALVQEVSEKKYSYILSRDLFCDILVKKIFTIFPSPKSLAKAKMKRFGLI